MKFKADNDLRAYFGDERLLRLLKYDKSGSFKCIYCFNKADSREHLPSKVFLDEPYPEMLAILPACKKCNNSFSNSEQYLACLIDYVKFKVYRLKEIPRLKIRNTFDKRPGIIKAFEKSTHYTTDGFLSYIEYDTGTIEDALKKLAIGHLMYSFSEIVCTEPTAIQFSFVFELAKETIDTFNSNVPMEIAPEIGSRDTELFITNAETMYTWKIIQENQYRFISYIGINFISVRIVIGEFLYAEIVWKDLNK